MLAALITLDGEIIARKKQPTHRASSDKEFLSGIAKLVHELLDDRTDFECLAMGIAFPGPINAEEGIILNTPNIGITDVPVAKMLEKEFHFPVFLSNDVNAGILGEYKKGAGVGSRNVVGIFPGTGVGGGLILNGHLYRGSFGGAGELGHMIIMPQGPMCGCGKRGCLEALASRTALSKELVHLAAVGDAPTVHEFAGTDYKMVKSKVIKKAMQNNETRVIDSVKQNAYYLGIGMANAANIFNPDCIILGGGLVEKLGDNYVKWAAKSMREHGMKDHVENLAVKAASLGDDAVPLGAGLIALERLGNGK